MTRESRGNNATQPKSQKSASASSPRRRPTRRARDGPYLGPASGGGGVAVPMASPASGGRAGKHQRLSAGAPVELAAAAQARSLGPRVTWPGLGRASPARVTLYPRAPRRAAPALGAPLPTPAAGAGLRAQRSRKSRRSAPGRPHPGLRACPRLVGAGKLWRAYFSVVLSGEGSCLGFRTLSKETNKCTRGK